MISKGFVIVGLVFPSNIRDTNIIRRQKKGIVENEFSIVLGIGIAIGIASPSFDPAGDIDSDPDSDSDFQAVFAQLNDWTIKPESCMDFIHSRVLV